MFRSGYLRVLIFSAIFYIVSCDCNPENYRSSSIVPQIIDKAPSEELKVTYPEAVANCGNEIEQPLLIKQPTLNYEAEENVYYTLIMIDPDAPDPKNPVSANFIHWLIVNIPGSDVHDGKELQSYYPPSPPAYSDSHRYIFLVYRQSAYLENPTYMAGKGRTKFDLRKALKDLKLADLVAGNFFYTRTN